MNIANSTSSRGLRILVLGGTRYIGPHFVRSAISRGHEISTFNRGNGGAEFPASVERLVGDRNGNLDSIRNRDWDAVIDLAAYVPAWVRSVGEALGARVRHYTFISTISVYGVPAPEAVTEDGHVLVYSGADSPYSITTPGEHYGSLKALCERESELQFPGRTLILRPGYIVGPGDTSSSFTYWIARAEKGGEVLVAGDPSMLVQFIDVRDLAEWAIRLIEANVTGIFNAVGPPSPMRFDEMLTTALQVASMPSTLNWVPPAWLANHKDRGIWKNLLFWTDEPGGYAGTMRINNERALARGLTVRQLTATYMDAFCAYKQQLAEQGAAHERKERNVRTGWDLTPIPWPAYLARERDVLAAWRAQQTQKS